VQERNLDSLDALVAAKLRELSETIRLAGSDRPADAVRLVQTAEGKHLMDDLRALIARMKAEEERVLSVRSEASGARTRRMAVIIGAGSLLGMLLIGAATLIVNRDMARRSAVEASLQRAQAELEGRVAARTAELSRTNTDLMREIEARRRFESALADSEKRYRTLFDQSPVGVCAFTSDLSVIQANARLAEMLGRRGESLDGARLDQLFGESFRASGLLTGEPLRVEVELRAAVHGDEPGAGAAAAAERTESRWLSVHLAPLADEAGGVVGGLAVVEDVSERLRAERRLGESLKQIERMRDDLLSVLDRLQLAAAVVDREGRVAFVSRTAEALIGRGQPLVGGPWKRLLPLRGAEAERLEAMMARPPHKRARLPLELDTGAARQFVEIEAHDDPRDASRRILVFHDVSEVRELRRLLDERPAFLGLVGRSQPMQGVYDQIRELARVDSTVLIEGATGTGKELVARAIHVSSARQAGPFVAVNCAGLTESLATSQLFGHRRGSFTGAYDDRTGFFEAANGGTLFLDEIGDLPLGLQTALLRVLQEREVARVGDSHARKVDVRVLAASQSDLALEAAAGRFRADLLYRIRVATIRLPSLAERLEDVPLLAAAFLDERRAATAKNVDEIRPQAMRALIDYAWPGNVRELKSAIESAVIRCQGRAIGLADLPAHVAQPAGRGKGEDGEQSGGVSDELLAVLRESRGNRAAAARRLGISRTTLYRRLARVATSGTALGSERDVGES
jgi:PAS domain S-box-containing protein